MASALNDAVQADEAVGVQVAVVNANGQPLLCWAGGCTSYTSWQTLVSSDSFPLGASFVARPLVAAAMLQTLSFQGIDPTVAVADLWPGCRFSGSLLVNSFCIGGCKSDEFETLVCPPPEPSTAFISNADSLASWVAHKAPALGAGAAVPPWWPPAAHAACCIALLRAMKAGDLRQALGRLFRMAGAGQPTAASGSRVVISKPVLGVESAEVEAEQDALLASVDSDMLQCMHLADVCLANHKAQRSSEEMPCGLASPALDIATTIAYAIKHGHLPEQLLQTAGDLGCIQRTSGGAVVVVLLTCANLELARTLANAAVKNIA